MVRDEEKYLQAIAFRRRGFTLAEIAKLCDISKSTVSGWCKGHGFSQEVTSRNKRRAGAENAKRLQLVNKTKQTEQTKRQKASEQAATLAFKHYKLSPLFMAGLMLYAADGDRRDPARIRLSNRYPETHRIFIRFLTEFLGVEKRQIRCYLLLYPTHDEVACQKHWVRVLKLTPANFTRNQVLTQASAAKPLHFGVGNTIIGSTQHKRTLMTWLSLATKELQK